MPFGQLAEAAAPGDDPDEDFGDDVDDAAELRAAFEGMRLRRANGPVRAIREREVAPDSIENEINFYFKLIKTCDDPVRLTRLAKVVGGELAPQQLRRLYQRVAALPDAELVKAFRAQAPGWMLFQRQEPPAFRNTRISANVRLFEAVGTRRANKTLLVLFTGRRGEAFVPMSRMLARLPPKAFDVLRLRPDIKGEYPRGVPGIGGNFLEVCAYIRGMVPDYAGGAALGTSLGGFAALRGARLAGLGVGISLSGRFTLFRPEITAMDVASFDPLCACSRAANPTLIAYYSADNQTDTLNGAMLKTIYPAARLKPVKDSKIHNVVAQLTATGEFDTILAQLQTLGARDPAARAEVVAAGA